MCVCVCLCGMLFDIIKIDLRTESFISYVYKLRSTKFLILCFIFNIRGIGMYQMRCTAYKKIASDDGLIQSETCRAYIENKV